MRHGSHRFVTAPSGSIFPLEAIDATIDACIEQGIEKGIEQGIEGLAAKLRACGVDDALIDEAIAAYRSENACGA